VATGNGEAEHGSKRRTRFGNGRRRREYWRPGAGALGGERTRGRATLGGIVRRAGHSWLRTYSPGETGHLQLLKKHRAAAATIRIVPATADPGDDEKAAHESSLTPRSACAVNVEVLELRGRFAVRVDRGVQDRLDLGVLS
jgi:hypothetical protein